MTQEPDLELTEAIYDALDRHDPDAALGLAQGALSASGGADPVLRFLAGRALFELDRPNEAAEEFLRAVAIDPDDAEFRAFAAWSLLRACRFDEAREHATAAQHDARLPEAHYVQGLLLEREGRLGDADSAFALASRLEPDWFPLPTRVSRGEFERCLTEARDALPESFRRHLDDVDVAVDDLPSETLLAEGSPPFDPEQLLGLFTGVPRSDRGSFDPGGELPPRILLFKRNLERHAGDAEELAEQIRITLYHELGHFLGMDEDDLEDSGYA